MIVNAMSNPTLADVAVHADVSLATVDRVMNDRPGVSERMKRRVFKAASQIGYLELQAELPRAVRLAFILPEGTNTFVHELARHVEEQAALMQQVSATVELVRGFDPVALVEKFTSLRHRVDGIAMLAVDHPIVREALRGLVSAGMAVATIGSDVRTVDHLGYIGIDDMQAGRMAGYLIGRLTRARPGKVAFFAGSLSYRGHQEREMGFRQILREEFPDLEVVAHREVQDRRALAEIAMAEILEQHPDLDAVYNAGGGTTGIATVLERTGRAREIIFIAHDLTDGNKSLLLHGTLDALIDQNARLEVREALTTLVHDVRGVPYRMVPPRLQIVFRENLPSE
tara:strand:- start:113587 stop:114609 length:1023 start_codon:yes stop_codon:yes gene_type:complete